MSSALLISDDENEWNLVSLIGSKKTRKTNWVVFAKVILAVLDEVKRDMYGLHFERFIIMGILDSKVSTIHKNK